MGNEQNQYGECHRTAHTHDERPATPNATRIGEAPDRPDVCMRAHISTDRFIGNCERRVRTPGLGCFQIITPEVIILIVLQASLRLMLFALGRVTRLRIIYVLQFRMTAHTNW